MYVGSAAQESLVKNQVAGALSRPHGRPSVPELEVPVPSHEQWFLRGQRASTDRRPEMLGPIARKRTAVSDVGQNARSSRIKIGVRDDTLLSKKFPRLTLNKLVSYEELRRREDAVAQSGGRVAEGLEHGTDDMFFEQVRCAATGVYENTAFVVHNHEKASGGNFATGDDQDPELPNEIHRAVEDAATNLAPEGQALSALVLGGAIHTAETRSAYYAVKDGLSAVGLTAPTEIWGAPAKLPLAGQRGPTSPPNLHVVTHMPEKINYICFGDSDGSILSIKGLAYWFDTFKVSLDALFEAQGETYDAASAVRAFNTAKAGLDPNARLSIEELNARQEPDSAARSL